MKVHNKFQLLLCLIVIGLMVGCGSTQTTITDQDLSTEGFGVSEEGVLSEEESPSEEISSEEVLSEEILSEEEPSEEAPSEEEHTSEEEAHAQVHEDENLEFSVFDVVVAWPVISSDVSIMPENPVLVTMADSVMTVETECYMFSGRFTADPRLSISPLAEIDAQCDNISAEEQALVDILPAAHSYYFRGDNSVELAYGDGLIIVLEAQASDDTAVSAEEVESVPVSADVSD